MNLSILFLYVMLGSHNSSDGCDTTTYFETYESMIQKTFKKKLKCKKFEYQYLKVIDDPSTILESYKILGEDGASYLLYCGSIMTCDLGGCTASKFIERGDESKEYFDVLVITDENQNILHIKVLNYFSDYGYEITSKSYLKKYKSRNVCDFNTDIKGVDSMSGATISCNALNTAIEQICSKS